MLKLLSRKPSPASDEAPAAKASDTYPIRTALELTIRTLGRRARAYRMLVITVVAILFLTVIACVIFGSAWPLAALLYLLPACSLYFCWDVHVLVQWRRALLASWSAADIDFGPLRQGLRMNTALPMGTVEGMLETLPTVRESGVAESSLSGPTRAAIERASNTIDACRNDALRFNCMSHMVIATAVIMAVWQRSWLPLLLGVSAPMLVLIRIALTNGRVTAIDREQRKWSQGPEFDRKGYLSVVQSLDWKPISSDNQEKLLSQLDKGT